MRGQSLLHEAERIRKSWQLLGVPGSLLNWQFLFLGMHMSEQGDHRKQAEQSRCAAQDRKIGPLSLGLDAQMRAHFMKSNLDLPATHKPLDDLHRRNRGICA